MKRSTERILTTHVGSLPRPDDLVAMMQARENGQPYDEAVLVRRAGEAVRDCVGRQIETGIDFVNDGEQGKPSFVTYVNGRLGGFERGGVRASPWRHSREARDFPEFYADAAKGRGPSLTQRMICTGPITYQGLPSLRRSWRSCAMR